MDKTLTQGLTPVCKGFGRSTPVGLFIVLTLLALVFNSARGQDLSTAEAPGAQIIGRVVNSETGEPLPFANLVLKRVTSAADTVGEDAGGTFTMQDGKYRLSARPGLYMILASYIGYHPKRVIGIEVPEDGAPVTAHITLVPTAIEVEKVEVKSYKDETSEVSILMHQRKAPAVSDGVGAEQIDRTSDSDAAEVLQRVTGLSLVGGRYIYVRGLGERYSSTQVDGASIGTPEPNKRVVPLDIFAAGLLDNIFVQKTYTPDKPADFGGGVVNINTRDFPGKRIWGLSISSGYANSTTGKGFLTYPGGSYDFLGIDDGTRELPDLVKEIAPRTKVEDRGVFSPDTIELLGESFKNTWEKKTKKAFAPYSLKASYGDEFQLFDQSLGLLASLSFSNSFKTSHGKEIKNVVELDNLVPERDYDSQVSQQKALWGLIANASYRLNSHNTVTVRTMYNRSSEDEVRFLEGLNRDTIDDQWRNVRYRYIQRGLFTGSVATRHNVAPLAGLTVDARYSYSRATRDEPDRREYNYGWVDSRQEWRLSTKTNELRPTRHFGNMVEDQRLPEIHATLPFRQWNGLDAKLKLGASYENKDRDFWYRRFYFKEPSRLPRGVADSLFALNPEELLTEELIGGTSETFRLGENTQTNTDAYHGKQNITATYAMVDIPLHPKLRLVGGVRMEDAEILLDTYDLFDPSLAPISSKVSDTDWLPSINATYTVSSKANIRLAASRTINRPEFREISPFNIQDIEGGFIQTGNTQLKRARIDNYDARFEVFPGLNEIMAVSLFYKGMKDPIEKTLVASSGPPLIKPQNVKKGEVYGGELEARIGLGRFARALNNFAASGNLTLVESETDVGDISVQKTSNPPLQGQSPYIVNLSLYYASDSGATSAAIFYNVFGKRLDALGSFDNPDIYEMPRHMVDMSLQHRIGGYRFKLAVENLLDEEVRFEQKQASDGAGKATHISELGRSVSLSVSIGS